MIARTRPPTASPTAGRRGFALRAPPGAAAAVERGPGRTLRPAANRLGRRPGAGRTGRGSIGDNSVLGDPRWAGMYGVDADFVAEENCRICCISAAFIRVRYHNITK